MSEERDVSTVIELDRNVRCKVVYALIAYYIIILSTVGEFAILLCDTNGRVNRNYLDTFLQLFSGR